MLCPDCGSDEFGVASVDTEGVVRLCSTCSYIEEATLSEFAEFTEVSTAAAA
jgi:hypothetical protein